MLNISARFRPMRSAMKPKNTPPMPDADALAAELTTDLCDARHDYRPFCGTTWK